MADRTVGDSPKSEATNQIYDSEFNPFTLAPACTISGLKKCADAPANSNFFGPITHLLSMLCVLMKIVSRPCAKMKKKGLKVKVQGF